MKRLAAVSSPRVQVWVAGLSLALWMVLSPIAMATGLKSALWWITFMSLFANVATCFGWWVAALVNVKAERIDDRSDEVATVAHIESLATALTTAVDRIDHMEITHGDQLAQILEAVHFPEPRDAT